jgi:hypothetical protein
MVIRERELIFLHPSKTGGTSIEVALCGSKNLTPELKQEYAIWSSGSQQHWPLVKLLEHRPEAAHYRQIATTRHPYDRFVSEFNYQLAGNRYKKSHFERLYKNRDLNGTIKSGALWECQWPWHGAKQCLYVGPSTELLRCDTLTEDWNKLFPDIPLPHCMKSRHYASVDDLDEDARKEIFRRYEDDFKFFNYEA